MPTVAEEGRLKFKVYANENAFEPPHVHVFSGNESVCRIDLTTGRFMDVPPPGEVRGIMRAFRRHATAIWEGWEKYHGK